MFFSSKKNNLKDILKEARERKTAVGQFNFSTLEQLQGIVKAAKVTGKAVICGTSQGEAGFFGVEEAVAVLHNLKKREGVSAFLNFDHGNSFEDLKRAVDAGYDMVHFDGSEMEFEECVEATKKIVTYARKRGVVVEGEISKIGGKSSVSEKEPEEVVLTPLEKVVRFIELTDVDCVALDVGNAHGVYKSEPRIYSERVSDLLKEKNCFVVFHGGSGVGENTVRTLIKKGVVKININTELRLAWRNALAEGISNNLEIVPYKILPLAREEVFKKVEEKIKIFNYYEKSNF
jgi:fructose-bisphosphate aldolase, class II